MSTPLYDLASKNYLQALHAVAVFMDKGLEHLREAGVDPEEVVAMRLYDDMLPFRFQVQSVVHHSAGALEGVMQGEFGPPRSLAEDDYVGLQKLVEGAIGRVNAISETDVNARAGAGVIFRLGEREMPFTAENFVQTFSLPNVHFHAATAYGMLRAKGVPLGKRDYLGQPRANV